MTTAIRPINHGLTFGFGGGFDGYYYNPNFLNFNITPYYNQSRADSDYQSLTNASGVAASANFFTGSHFPVRSVITTTTTARELSAWRTTPNFTTQGNGQGFGINWSCAVSGLANDVGGISVWQRQRNAVRDRPEDLELTGILNVQVGLSARGLQPERLLRSRHVTRIYPDVLTGTANLNDSQGYDTGISASRNIPFWNGAFSANYSHTSYSSNYVTPGCAVEQLGLHRRHCNRRTRIFTPWQKLSLFANENYTE